MLSLEQTIKILRESPDPTAIYDNLNLNISFANDAMLKLWGRDRSVIGKRLEEALPELNDQPFLALLQQVWLTREAYTGKNTPATLLIEGQPKTSYFDFQFSAVLNDQGETYAILHTATDVTSRVTAWEQVEEKQRRESQLIYELSATNRGFESANEHLDKVNRELVHSNNNIRRLNERLQESETDFRRLIEQAPVALMVLRGKNLVIDLANQEMLKILDKDFQIIGHPLLEGLPEIKGQPAVNLLFEVHNTGKSFDGNEAPVRMMRSGIMETRYFNFSYRPLLDNGRIIGVMDLAVEVTEQVLARKNLEDIIAEKTRLQQDLYANEQRLQRILDTMAEGVVIIDNSFKPSYINPMAQKIMGITEQEFLEHNYYESKWQNFRLDGSVLPIADHPMNVALKTGIPVYDQEIAIVPPDGRKIYISINAVPLVNEKGVVTGGIATFTDATNRRMILQQKDDFISVASHELKTPVTSLKASLQLLDQMQAGISPELLAKLLAQANKSLNKLSDLVNSLLNSNRLSQGRFPLNITSFSLADLINDCCQHVRSAGTHELILEGDVGIQIEGDEQLLDQVLINLVNNAVKYAPDSKKIIIRIDKRQNDVKVSITDFGPGISKEKLTQLFERYYQADSGNGQFSGLGLGLYICAEIIQKHGGKIGVDSEPGQGSTFWFTVPDKVIH